MNKISTGILLIAIVFVAYVSTVKAAPPPPIPGCPLSNTLPTGEFATDTIYPHGAVWCFPQLVPPSGSTATQGPNSWVDSLDFDAGAGLGIPGNLTRFADHDLSYRIFENIDNGGSRRTQHASDGDGWFVDMAGGFLGGSMLRPDRSFNFQNGMLVFETDFAAGIPGYLASGGGDVAWGEMIVTSAAQPDGSVDSLYGYGQFSGNWTVGCRLHSGGNITCAVESSTPTGLNPNDQSPCFSFGSFRVSEISGFQQCGTSHYSYDEHAAEVAPYFRHCLNTDNTFLHCKDRFRMEITKTGLSVYVNGHIYLQDIGWNAAHSLPDSFLNGPVYTYVADWTDVPNRPLYRFHWDKISVNPPTMGVSPSFCLGQPRNYCPNGGLPSSTITPTAIPPTSTATPIPPTVTPTPTSMPSSATPTPSQTPTPMPTSTITPIPTDVPSTSTPEPTSTPNPTSTPTPVPTSTLTPTPVPSDKCYQLLVKVSGVDGTRIQVDGPQVNCP